MTATPNAQAAHAVIPITHWAVPERSSRAAAKASPAVNGSTSHDTATTTGTTTVGEITVEDLRAIRPGG
jgi:hypothetical protein